jgi:hypothetical protein
MRIFQILWVILVLVAASAARAQTRVDLRTQSRNVDFSSASTTKPVRTGTTLPSTCTTGEMFFKTDAIPGQNLQMCTITDTWTAIMGSGGGGGGGSAATATAELLDFQVLQLNTTTLGIGLSCSTELPCAVRFGNTTTKFINGATVSLSSGTPTGVAFIYITSQGSLVVGHNLTGTVTCSSGCTAQSGVTSIPHNAIPVASWTVTNGAWDTGGGTDFRGYLSIKNIAAGTGLLSTELNGLTTIGIYATVIGVRVGIPATATTACTQGTWAADDSFHYVCVSTDTWRRAALSTW